MQLGTANDGCDIPRGNMHLSEAQLLLLSSCVGVPARIGDAHFSFFGLQAGITVDLELFDAESLSIVEDSVNFQCLVLEPGFTDFSEVTKHQQVWPRCWLYEGVRIDPLGERGAPGCGIILPNGFVRHVWRDPADVFTALTADAFEIAY